MATVSYHLVLGTLAALLIVVQPQMHGSRVMAAGSEVIIQNLCGEDVHFYCSSAERTLGNHMLRDQQEFHWRFYENMFRPTEYFCNFTRTAPTTGQRFEQSFAVWKKGNVVDDVECQQCLWNVDAMGFLVWNKATKSFYRSFYWNMELNLQAPRRFGTAG